MVVWDVGGDDSGGRGGGDTAARTQGRRPWWWQRRWWRVTEGARRGRVPGVRRAPSVPMESGNEEMKLPLTLEIQARAMAHALLREVHVGRG